MTVFLLLCAGCANLETQRKHYEPVTAELKSGNTLAAAEKLEKAYTDGKFPAKDRLLYYLDAGLLHYYAGDYDSSILRLQAGESAAEELFTKSIRRAAVSLLLNDNVLEYAGEDYEILYSNLICALAYLQKKDVEGSFVEIRRANLKLELLEQKYNEAARMLREGADKDTNQINIDYQSKEVRFNNDAFARWLSMHLYAQAGKYDDARIDHDLLKEAFVTQPHIYNFTPPDVRYSADSGKAILSVVGLSGLAPTKEAFTLRLRTDKQLDLVQILYTDSENKEVEYGHLPMNVKEDYFFEFAIPRVAGRASAISKVRASANGKLLGELSLIEDITTVAKETFEAKRSLIYLRSVARAVAKGLINHQQKSKVKDDGLGGWLKKALVDVVTDLSEAADLRTTQYLPGRVQIADFQVEPGTYDVTVSFLDSYGSEIERRIMPQVTVSPGQFNLVQAFSPK